MKATVDAYTGAVTLYPFDDSDPVLKVWNKAFGGKLIKPSSKSRPTCATHFRYPEDQFKVQRELLTRFHVTDANQFYSVRTSGGTDEPAPAAAAQGKQAPYYLLAKFPGQTTATFQLTAGDDTAEPAEPAPH